MNSKFRSLRATGVTVHRQREEKERLAAKAKRKSFSRAVAGGTDYAASSDIVIDNAQRENES